MNPHTSAASPGTPPGHHRGAGPGGIGKRVLAKVFLNSAVVPLFIA